MTTTLICVLGKVPGPVTTTVHALKGRNLRPDRVYVLQTDEAEVKNAASVVEAYLKRDQIAYHPVFVAIENITDDNEADIFRRELDKVFKSIQKTKDDCLIVSMTGGRKSMSAFITLTAQFYPVDHLFDTWVDPHYEQESISPRIKDEYCRKLEAGEPVDKLEPTAEHCRLIEFPLMPLLDFEETIANLDTLSLTEEIPTTIKLPKDRLNLVLRGMTGRVDIDQAHELMDLEILLRQAPRSDRSDQIRKFLSNQLGIPFESQHWPSELSDDKTVSEQEFEDNVLAVIQKKFESMGFPIDLVSVWQAKQAEILYTYSRQGNAAQYLVTLLMLAFRVGYTLPRPTVEELTQIGPVFVSYARLDLAAVKRVVQDLRGVGVDIRWDQDIRGGQQWFNVIRTMMDACKTCIFFVTKTSLEKNRGYIRQELSYYSHPGRQLIPVLFDGQKPDQDDPHLSDHQWLHFQQRRYDEFFGELLKSLIAVTS